MGMFCKLTFAVTGVQGGWRLSFGSHYKQWAGDYSADEGPRECVVDSIGLRLKFVYIISLTKKCIMDPYGNFAITC